MTPCSSVFNLLNSNDLSLLFNIFNYHVWSTVIYFCDYIWIYRLQIEYSSIDLVCLGLCIP